MTCHFEAKVDGIPCKVYLNDEFRIYDVLFAGQPWRITDENGLYARLEEQYDYLIAECRKEDDVEFDESQKHINALRNMGAYV